MAALNTYASVSDTLLLMMRPTQHVRIQRVWKVERRRALVAVVANLLLIDVLPIRWWEETIPHSLSLFSLINNHNWQNDNEERKGKILPSAEE